MDISRIVREVLIRAYKIAHDNNNEFITPEHLVLSALEEDIFKDAITKLNGNVKELKDDLINYIDNNIDKVENKEPEESYGIKNVLIFATQQAAFSERNMVALEHIMAAIYTLKDSYAVYFLQKQGIEKQDLLYELSHNQSEMENASKDAIKIIKINPLEYKSMSSNGNAETNKILGKYCTELTNLLEIDEYSLIGREDIINRTIQILSRKTKNNPVHIGEPGVGKTAITMGLVKLIKEGKVPNKLKNAKVFSLDIGSILAGTKYRGDFEERIKLILDEISKSENSIVYIDEIHNIVGAGALNGSSLDGGNLIKGYLLEGKIKFIGATTYDDYKKYFEKDKALIRRFQVIEVKETSIDETIEILKGIKESFEKYHNVKYNDDALEEAVKLSARYINDKFLPDKAIDIMDEAGAYVDINRDRYKEAVVNKEIIEEIISKTCNIPKQTIENTEAEALKSLEEELKKKIFGQDSAIEEVTRAIKLSRAGLTSKEKPVASLLFVGPTGVGKTEIAKVLSQTLGVELVRFDMSEYGEKHSAAKLIGSPPGYVGYEEGGLLTDTIRKKPNSVLLLDEIEKAHPDILNVLLQVMDYGILTDNKGRKSDFRNVIIIMTSNVGARNLSKNSVGFLKDESKQGDIKNDVSKAFSPEFRNRLDKVVIFNEINEEMAINITKNELNKFKEMLISKKVFVNFTDKCIKFISEKGLSKEYGAREIIRVINADIKPLLVDELLFGDLSNGGECEIDVERGKFIVNIQN
ncbi:AAA family ATPase [Clostridium isatidis]|uniref:ATP-dependent Clp protease ATP-binding subunit ClpA n=1 Tax=Clostridium isatidis TaxID=182773 RepID=A0A343JBY0_9CLOT|nr:AAA family ATPase [Clostridium isatidis]ASW43038.1 ATP-dependent Clp protease ATP-binding subunit ClpA [Clostridium isatidis]NLZ35542.1 AAA domain-containing protein [Clostridiales bacterium]